MKLRKIPLVALTIIMFITFIMMSFTEVSAVKTETPIYIGLGYFMTENPNFGYAIGDPAANAGKTERVSATIWNLLKYDSATSTTYKDQEIYCLREGEGFLNSSGESDIGQIREYNESYNMKAEKENVISKVYQWNKTIDNVDQYNAILAVLDLFYIEGSSSEDYKETLLENAVGKAQYQSYMDEQKITDSDIKAVQQAALWYFTNYGENTNNLHDKTQNTAWLNYTEDGASYTSLSGYKSWESDRKVDIGLKRQEQAELLYNYFITTAKANASKYSDNLTNNIVLPAKVNTQKLEYIIDGENYIVGPINIIEQESSNVLDSIILELKNGNNTISTYTLLKEDKSNANTTDIKDLLGENFYISIPKANLVISDLEASFTVNYSNTNLKLWTHSTNKTATQPVVIPQRESNSKTTTLTVQEIKTFDLALRKYITKVNGVELSTANTRVPKIDETTITSSTTTSTYKHRKDPVLVENGSIVTYKLTIYNEGQKDGRATKVIDQLPTGLKFSKVVSGNFELGSYSEVDNTLNLVRKENSSENLAAYIQGNLDSETIEIECEVIATPDETNTKILTNVAWISEEIDVDGNVITNKEGLDIDSEPSTKPGVNKDNMENYTGNNNKSDLSDDNYYYKGQQDDDDFEKLMLMPESFDLKLIKRITAVNDQSVKERIEKVDVSKLNTLNEKGELITTGKYTLNKEPVSVKKGDIVTYTFRIYNEGTIDGYAAEITEDIPEGLEYLWDDGIEYNTDGSINWNNVTKEFTDEEKEAIEFNFDNGWSYAGDSTLKTIKTDYLSRDNETVPGDGSNLIKAFGNNDGTKTESDILYKEVSVKLKVISEDVTGTIIRNEACISEDTNQDGDIVDDRDSSTEIWKKYEDDEDYDNIVLKSFDLALRKFIIAISADTEIENSEYLKNDKGLYTRAPSVDTSKLNTIGEDGKLITTATYNHTKEPVMVQRNDIVVYMLRVYNEGEIDGYAAEIKDHLPPHLEFVEGEFNKEYGWKVSEDGRTVTTDYLKDEKIKAAEWIPQKTGMTDKSDLYKLTYKEVPIMCKVKDTAKSDENITNIADITKYLDENKESVNDRDSQEDNVVLPEDDKLPTYKDDETGEYIPGQQDDDDFEKLIVKEFDLALRKWVTQAIVIDKNGQTITETGHQPYDDPEQVVKVELHRKKYNQVTVKFRYSIRVINEGDIAGYAKEVTDYVPQGLKFVAEDNKGWTDEGNNVISTRLLENTLLQPGEYADVEVVLTWINSQDNMGVMINTAEISEDYNDYDVPDKDSIPDNQKPGEDDIDDAPVMLTISTGQMRIYFTLGFIILITIAGGIVLIKKYVL